MKKTITRIMNFFKKLFGMNKKPIEVDPNLFMDNNPPLQNTETKKEQENMNTTTKNNLSNFQETKTYYDEGELLGYQEGNYESQNARIRTIKAEFRNTIAIEMEEFETQKLQTRSQIIDNSGISKRLHQQYELKLEQLESKLQELEEMRALSVDDEGFIAPIIHAFKQGFIAGIELRNKENNTFTPTKIYA
jgi:hypothetical protein